MFKKEFREIRDTAIIKAFHEGKTYEQIAKIVTDLKLPYVCADCHEIHEYVMNPNTVVYKLANLGLIPYKIIEDMEKEYHRVQSRIRSNARTNVKLTSCASCGSKERLEVHHIIPVYKGGTNIKKNLRVLCHDCHNQLHRPELQCQRR